MKNKQEIVGLITNIVLVVLLLCFIVVGLNYIGIYSLPEPVEKLLGTSDSAKGTVFGGDSDLYLELDFDEGAPSFESVQISYENAYDILASLNARNNYSHSVRVTDFFDGLRRTEIFIIDRKNGLYHVDACDESGNVIKSVSEDGSGVVTITEFYNESAEPAVISKGNFNIYEECGFVLTPKEFLESGYELASADFSRINRDDGVFLSVVFDNSYNGRSLRQKYVFSLDFGIVVEVYSYENDTIVYEMLTESLSMA